MNFNQTKALVLIEVLLAWAILGFFFLSLGSEQVAFVRKREGEEEKILAYWQLESMAERLKANKTEASRLREFKLWNMENQKLLPKAEANWSCLSKSCEIQLKWGRNGYATLWI